MIDVAALGVLLDKIPYKDLIKISSKFKKPRFKHKDNVCRLGELLNSYGSYKAFIRAVEHSRIDDEDEDMHILKYLYEDDKMVLHYCLYGRINFMRFAWRYLKWFFKYFWYRNDLDFCRRLFITIKKSFKYVYRFNYDTRIDLEQYYKYPERYNQIIYELFRDRKIDRLNLYRYEPIETVEEFQNRMRTIQYKKEEA